MWSCASAGWPKDPSNERHTLHSPACIMPSAGQQCLAKLRRIGNRCALLSFSLLAETSLNRTSLPGQLSCVLIEMSYLHPSLRHHLPY